MNEYDPAAAALLFPSTQWQKPLTCGPDGGNCVEINLGVEGVVGMRDSKLPGSPVLIFSDDEWREFLGTAATGRYDR